MGSLCVYFFVCFQGSHCPGQGSKMRILAEVPIRRNELLPQQCAHWHLHAAPSSHSDIPPASLFLVIDNKMLPGRKEHLCCNHPVTSSTEVGKRMSISFPCASFHLFVHIVPINPQPLLAHLPQDVSLVPAYDVNCWNFLRGGLWHACKALCHCYGHTGQQRCWPTATRVRGGLPG